MLGLPEVARALLKPEAYAEVPGQIELRQTQMSFVFLTDDYVYKVKKPVNLGYLDYTTLEKRHYFCWRELELNRRLCPDTYLGVVPIVRRQGNILIGGQGEVIEYAVKMRRLPQARMMDFLLRRNKVLPEMVVKVAKKLARFHQRAETGAEISAFGDLLAIWQNISENFTQTEKYIGNTISRGKYQRLKGYNERFLEEKASLFKRRVVAGKIRDCHGDLHAAHICFTRGICIYDCIEFNDRFRYSDVASEVAFLAMDLDHYGCAELSHSFVNAYVDESKDKELLELLNFYKCYRAYVRGKVASFKLDDPYITQSEKGKTKEVARSYFELASAYIRSRPILLITTGLVGTGKTTLALALAGNLGLVVISSDITRKELASIPKTEHRFEEFDSGIYSPEFSRLTYDTMFTKAGELLSKDRPVIIDASFTRSEERQKAKELAQEAGADFFIVECRLDEGAIKKRLEERLKEGSVSDGRWEIFESQKKRWKAVTEVPKERHLIIDASLPANEAAKQILEKINGE